MSCSNQECPLEVEAACKPEAGGQPFRIDLFEFLVDLWQPDTDYTTGRRVRPQDANGFALQAASNGTSGPSPPRFKPSLGANVPDGGLSWTVIAAGANGLATASDEALESIAPTESGGLDVDDLTIVGGRYLTGTYVQGVAGTTYTVTFLVTVDSIQRAIRQQVRVS